MLTLLHNHTSRDAQGRWVSRLDAVAIGLSGLCAIHCAALPVLMLVVPVLGTHEFEGTLRWVLATMGVVGIGLGALLHRNMRAVPFLLLALGTLVVGAFIGHGPWEIAASVAAAVFLIRAHWLNTRACRASAVPELAPAPIIVGAPDSQA